MDEKDKDKLIRDLLIAATTVRRKYRFSFRQLKDLIDCLEVDYWEIVSGKPAGEVYHRQVYIAFSESDAENCEKHILDEYEDWELDAWLYGPHIYQHHGCPDEAKHWNGHQEVAARIWPL